MEVTDKKPTVNRFWILLYVGLKPELYQSVLIAAMVGAMPSALLPILLAFQALQGCAKAQAVQCQTLAGGCDQGQTGQAALSGAISAFQDGRVYGNHDAIVFSSFASDNVLAEVSYSCQDSSIPPALGGKAIRNM